MNLEDCRKKLEELEEAREELLDLLRELRIFSSKAIVYIHSGKISEAEESIRKASEILEKVKNSGNIQKYTQSALMRCKSS
jgi:predicted translin family RNA/ssDNA-binding protein